MKPARHKNIGPGRQQRFGSKGRLKAGRSPYRRGDRWRTYVAGFGKARGLRIDRPDDDRAARMVVVTRRPIPVFEPPRGSAARRV